MASHGITISPSELQAASAYCDKVYLADLEHGIPKAIDDKFDYVILSHILEHLVHPEKLLGDIKSVLAPNGLIAIALPNVLFYHNRLRFILGNFDYTDGGIMDETHVRFYTFASGAKLLEASGYRLEKVFSDGAFPMWKIRNILPDSIVKALNRFAVSHWPGLFGLQSLYLARAAES